MYETVFAYLKHFMPTIRAYFEWHSARERTSFDGMMQKYFLILKVVVVVTILTFAIENFWNWLNFAPQKIPIVFAYEQNKILKCCSDLELQKFVVSIVDYVNN